MDHLWSPWRYQYISKAGKEPLCIFCTKPEEHSDEKNYIVYRGNHNFVILNLFPYTSGHLMIAPYAHLATLDEAPDAALVELILLTRKAERSLREVYRPEGFNIGMNLGKCAGAGVDGHIHMHVLPRWAGDANFMTTVGETRVLPEDLPVTFGKLRDALQRV